MKIIEGGVTAAKGFEAAATAAGIKYQGRTDMAIIYSEKPCKVAGTFTTNVVKAAPVKWDRQIVESKQKSQAVIVNSGIANACTGEEGMKYCEETAKEAGKVLGIDEKGVLVGSTGVIGMQIPIDKIKAGITELAKEKKADLASGTEAAKEAGEIVILDDNFKSIKDAILYGRTIYHNILKFCKFQLVINVTAVVVSAIAPFFGVEEPLKVTHLLFVNLVMDGLGAIMLGNEPALEKYMDEKPRRRDESIISKQMMGQILTMGLWLTVVSFVYLKAPFFKNLFENEEQHLTGYFVLFIVSALFNGFNVRDDGAEIFKGLDLNPGFLKVFFTIILVQAVIVNAGLIPFVVFDWIGEMFSCVPFGIKGWIAVILLAVTMIPVDLIRKAIVNKKH